MSQEIPEWFRLEIRRAYVRTTGGLPDHDDDFLNPFVEILFEQLCKPENAAKIECVKPVIKGLQKYLDNTLFVDEEGESYDSDFEHCIDFAKTALRPFKKEGSDE